MFSCRNLVTKNLPLTPLNTLVGVNPTSLPSTLSAACLLARSLAPAHQPHCAVIQICHMSQVELRFQNVNH